MNRTSVIPFETLSNKSFVRRLIISAVMINLLFAILTGVTLHHDRQQSEAGAMLNTQNICQVLEENISGTIREVDLALLTIKSEFERQQAEGDVDAATMNAFIHTPFSHMPQLDGVRIADSSGRLRYGTKVEANKIITVHDRDYFIQLRENPTAEVIISKPVVGRVTNRWVFVIARRLNHRDGSFAGIVYGAVLVESFNKLFASIHLGKDSVISLRDEQMGLIARHPENDPSGKAIGQSPVSKELQKLLAEERTEATYFTPTGSDNIARIVSYRKIGTHPLRIIVGISKQQYLADWWKHVAKFSILALCSLLATTAVSFMLYRSRRREYDAIDIIKQQENRYRIVANNTLDWEFWLDPAGKFVYTSPPVCG